MRDILVVEHADHADSAVSLADKIHDQDIVVVGMGLTVLAVRIGRVDENVVVHPLSSIIPVRPSSSIHPLTALTTSTYSAWEYFGFSTTSVFQKEAGTLTS